MSEVSKDPSLKLFGKTIQLLPDEENNYDANDSDDPTLLIINPNHTSLHQQYHMLKDPVKNHPKPSGGQLVGIEEEKVTKGDPRTPDVDKGTSVEDLTCPATSSGISEDHTTPSPDKEFSSPQTDMEDPSVNKNSEEKTLKKPDKIIPCPRCNSMDTKFCYYNNYNVNQPRHFCRNCQRYWTNGGTMRNVPVGSGRRKNKSSPASHFRHILVSEALQAARADAGNGIHHPNGSILTFGSASPLCESMTSALILADKSQNCKSNKIQTHEQRVPVSRGNRENIDDHSSGSSSTISNPMEKGIIKVGPEAVLRNVQGPPHQVPIFPVPPWPCPWNSAQSRSPMPQHAFGPSGYPMSFYSTSPYWGCTVPNPWSMPWLSPQSPSADHSVISSSPNSQTLGKHSRDGSMLRQSNVGKEDIVEEKDSDWAVFTPKTLRINDPNEAAKSSIWSTLEIKNVKTDSVTGTNLLMAFRPKGDEKNHMNETSLALQANPAALSRSLNFQETT